MPQIRTVRRIEILQKFQLTVAGGQKRHTQAADHPRWPIMIDDTIFVRGEALDGGFDLDIGLLAFDRQAQPIGKHRDRGLIIGAGDAQMVDTLDYTRVVARNTEFARNKGAHPNRVVQRRSGLGAKPRPTLAAYRFAVIQTDMVHPGAGRAIDKAIPGGEQGQRRLAHGENRHLAVFGRTIGKGQSKDRFQHMACRLNVAGDQGNVRKLWGTHLAFPYKAGRSGAVA